MTQYLGNNAAGEIIVVHGRVDPPEMAGPLPPPVENDGITYRLWNESFSLAKPTSTSEWRWIDDLPALVETAELDDLKAAAIAKTYADVDKVHFDAVGNRATEYQEAERAARAFAADGFQGEADDDVHSYAIDNTTGEVQADRWAAENIIARADAFRAAQKAMRTARFKQQAAMRGAASADDLAQTVAAWDSFIAGLRAQLGL